jgi:high affinity Mn2+ porin
MRSSRSTFCLLAGVYSLVCGTSRCPAADTPTTQPSASSQATTKPAVSIGTHALSIDLPTLSGKLFDQFAYSFHGQTTIIPQGHGNFPSAYTGPHSQNDNSDVETSYTGTLFTGVRLLPGTEIYFDPEVSAGSGIGHVLGISDFPNGEISRVSSPEPTPIIARLYLQQTVGFGGEQEDITDGQNQIAGHQDINRVTFTVGKFAATDIFDNNNFSHDPRTQFLNLGLVDDTAWDYPADTKGYIDGLAIEFNRKNYTLRYGIFREPDDANGGALDDHWNRAFGQIVEFEQRYKLFNHPGALRPMAYINYAHMGDYRAAIDQNPRAPDITTTRSYSHPKYGYGISGEQELTPDLGLFARAGWNNGQSETWAFTEVDRTASLGLSLKGTSWSRPNDVTGLAGVISGLAKDHRDYLADGGLGFILGDGQLRYAPEQILETYYCAAVTKNVFLALDYQFVNHPGFNADRGPISIAAFRFHFEF